MRLEVSSFELPMQTGDVVQLPPETDYNNLTNKPTLDGVVLQGNVHEKDPTVPDWAKHQSRPVYTAQDVGALDKEDVAELSVDALEALWASI